MSPSLRKHGLVSAQGPSSDCQFPAQVFVVMSLSARGIVLRKLCPVNVSLHLGTEHYSAGQYD